MRKNYSSRIATPEDLKLSWEDMLRAVFYLLEERKGKYVFYSISLFVILFYDLVPVFIMGKIVDFFSSYKAGNSLTFFYSLVLLLASTWAIISMIRLTLKKRLTNIQSEVTYLARVKGFERLLDFSLKWHDSENTGNKVQKIQQGTDGIKTLQKLLSNDIFPQLATILGVLTAFLFINVSFFIFGLCYLITFISVQIIFYRRIVKMNYDHTLSLEKASGAYYEGLSNVLTVKTLGVKDDFKKNISGREEASKDFAIARVAVSNRKWKIFQIVNALALGTVLILAGHNYLSGVISIGLLFVVYTYFQKLSGTMADSTQVIDDLIASKVSISRMMPIFWNDEFSRQGTLNFPKHWEDIRLQNCSFQYKKAEEGNTVEALKDVTISIRKHQKIGVVGRSGSGKSTLAKLLLGLYEFEQGDYRIGKTNFYDIKHDDVTKHVSLVLQDSEMFNLSLKDNITLMRAFDQRLFDQAIEISALKELIDNLPEGIDTLIGEKGYRLSGGERQRIGIARAIYKDPQILILDEATSSLDSKTESAILKAFEEKLNKKTIISIAHRISTLKNSDRIIVFDKGSIVEEGIFSKLTKDKRSKFFEIYQSQQMNDKVRS